MDKKIIDISWPDAIPLTEDEHRDLAQTVELPSRARYYEPDTEQTPSRAVAVRGLCRIMHAEGMCRGVITDDTRKEFDPTMGAMIIGPGSRNQFHTVSHGYYCVKCGVKYQFVPQEREEKPD